jgi:O-antigen/teichoic acid export membrane protein
VLVASTVIAALAARRRRGCCQPFIESYYVVPFVLGFVCLPMIALSDLLQGVSRANAWAVFALSPTYLVRPVLILLLMAAALAAGYAPDAVTALVVAILATWLTTVWQFVGVAGRIGRGAAGRAARDRLARMVRGLAADLPGGELLLPAHQCRRADGGLSS